MSKQKREDTIENRVYLFDSLAGQFVAAAADKLASANAEERERALRVMADLAWMSCVVADTGALEADEVRARVLAGVGRGETTQSVTKKGKR
jgi:hypothetical protein